jgi:signal transduction histidine kinase
MSILFTIFLSNPLRHLNVSARKIAGGDFSVQEPLPHKRLPDEIDELTENFNFMADALRREDALRKHLTSNIAHELRTPLTIIKGNLEAIEDGVMSDTGKVMENVTSEIQRITSLVEGIEDVTRAEASFFKKGSTEHVDLKEFIGSIIEGMREMIQEKGLYVKTEGPSISVETYPDKLHIILKNLLSNSYKFTKRGGITVSWDAVNDDGTSGFLLSVKDTGAGMNKDEASKVFNRFYKSAASGGKGLGLAIVKELVEVMDGTIAVESKPGHGTRFEIRF